MRWLSFKFINPWLWLGLIVAGWSCSSDNCDSARCAQAQIFKGSKMIQTPGGSGRTTGVQTKNFFTVMGEVRFPNTYELPTSSPSLVEFLNLAGGLLPNASGNLRIVRFTRTGQKTEEQLFYDVRRADKLQPGDILVVDSKIGNARIYNGPNQSTNESDVLIGVVGILEYPILIQLPQEQATIESIRQHLRQRSELAQSAKVCLPNRSSQRVTPDVKLPNNTLIHFDTAKVIVAELPQGLPHPFRLGVDTHPQVTPQRQLPPAATTIPNPAIIESPQVPDQSVALDPAPVDPPAGRVRVTDPNLTPKSIGRSEPKRFDPPTEAIEVSPEFQKPFRSESASDDVSDSKRDSTSIQLTPIEEEEIGKSNPSLALQGADSVAGRPINRDKAMAVDKPGVAPLKGELVPQPMVGANEPADGDALNQQDSTVETNRSLQGLNPKVVVGVVLGGLGTFTLCWVLLSSFKKQPVESQRIFAEPQRTRPLLDRLVNNELPIHIEDVRLDPSLRIHGRPRDVGRQRLDASQERVPRPHFMNRRPQSVPATPAVEPDRSPSMEREAPLNRRASADRSADRVDRVTNAERRVSQRSAREVTSDAQVRSGFDSRAVGETSRPKFRFDKSANQATSESDPRVKPQPVTLAEVSDDDTQDEIPRPTVVRPRRPHRETVAVTKNTAVNVTPSRVIADGSDIVDRALATFERGE